MTVHTSHEGLFPLSSSCQGSITPALAYHAFPVPGKFTTIPTKKLSCARDLSLAYSPGVAEACHSIAQHPESASLYTMRQHLVAVISNGTAVLGLGNIGALASKPVMEGKAVLFQVFSGLNAIDVEINEQDPEKLIEIIASLAPSFGAINLEDIKAPECFRIESELKNRLNIPVFHDDQHGTAIIVASAIMNALELVGKTLETSRCVVSGAGAGALACVGLLVELGMSKKNITLCDTKGVIHTNREDLSSYKRAYARTTEHRSLAEVLEGADILLGLSGPGSVTPEMVASMAHRPIIFALANPIPEIWPHEVQRVRSDAYVGTGRSDLPNQVNNVLCFPYIFRGAMDAGAKQITLPMKKACVQALSQLAKEGFVDITGSYDGEIQDFGPHYFIPKPFDLRLSVELPLAVARVAVKSGEVPAFDLDFYRSSLIHHFYKDFLIFKGLWARKSCPNKEIPALGYIIETLDDGIPNAVRAAARILKTHGLAKPYFVGNRAALLAQLRGDSVLAHVPVYSAAEYFAKQGMVSGKQEKISEEDASGYPKKIHDKEAGNGQNALAGRHIRVISEKKEPSDSWVQGWLYKDALHVYAKESPSPWMRRMLESCGCFFEALGLGDGTEKANISREHTVFNNSALECPIREKVGAERDESGRSHAVDSFNGENHSVHQNLKDGTGSESQTLEMDPGSCTVFDPSLAPTDISSSRLPSESSLNPLHPASTSPNRFSQESPLGLQPHFGGLAFKKQLTTVWHVDTPPKLFGKPCFGPISDDPRALICISAQEDVREGIETSAWALWMQETPV